MDELFRYQQLRQSEKLSDEQKRIIGLPLYPDDTYSPLANDLIGLNKGSNDDKSVADRLEEYARAAQIVHEKDDLQPAIRAMYGWLNFKSKPIKPTEFTDFVATLNSLEPFDLAKEWTIYADNLLVAIYRGNVSINYSIDYQLLIRICYLFKLCTVPGDGELRVREGTSANLLDAILVSQILLPPLVLRSRCSDCRKKGKVVLPRVPEFDEKSFAKPCQCKCDESCQKPSGHCICINTYIADLFIIKENLARYEEGDVAAIENILAGENKVRRHRNLFRTEETTETEEETISSEERDHQVAEKFSLQEEVKSTIDSKTGIDAGVTATLKYGEAVTITPHANVTADFSKSQSESLARSYAKEIVDRSVTKMQEKIRKLQITKIISEVEERNKHSIDNTQAGAVHRAGIYYWVNKVTHAQVFNYGKHMMFDAILPEPGAIFKRLYQEKILGDKERNAPTKPPETPLAITRAKYGDFLNKYAIASADDLQPPDPETAVQVAFSFNVTKPDPGKNTGFSSHEFKTADIPEGYKAARMKFDVRAHSGHPLSTRNASIFGGGSDSRDEVALSVHIGDTVLLVDQLNEHQAAADGVSLPLAMATWGGSGNGSMNGEEGTITVALAGFSTLAFSVSGTVSIICELKNEAFEKWQAKIYNLIMADYNRKLDEYNASNNKNEELIQIKGRNPFLNREIERNELKRHIVAMLLCNYFNGIGSMMEKVAPCGYPEIDFAKLERDAPIIQFFEQVFEWNYSSYLFYHSMWARKCKWTKLIDEDCGDPLFDKFLTAGAARVQVPIRTGMEDYFTWFLKTGQIWGASGVPPVSGDDEYVSMIQELKESKQGDYSDRPGLIEASQNSDVLKLTESGFYWDFVNDQLNTLAVANDRDRELLLKFEVYRIVKVEQTTTGDPNAWNITIDRPYPDPTAKNLKHAVGAVYVGAPWEVVIPTKLVYLRNPNDKLPVYPLP
ncbi:hypothetical protein [Pseudarthrobacter siccitolerans]|uniref:hypothetical protein n=1 Tax=Pseudarthrobacter siccitolerans TaxID=861266 RepID=UPI000B31D574|nr:hypothetical protein [Pseudarthrobacter siccitolerans]